MAGCPGAKKATKITNLIIGQKYCMWLSLKSTNGIPVEILGWRKSGALSTPVSEPSILKGMDPNFILLVKEISTAKTLQITDDPKNGGAMFYGTMRATFHEI